MRHTSIRLLVVTLVKSEQQGLWTSLQRWMICFHVPPVDKQINTHLCYGSLSMQENSGRDCNIMGCTWLSHKSNRRKLEHNIFM